MHVLGRPGKVLCLAQWLVLAARTACLLGMCVAPCIRGAAVEPADPPPGAAVGEWPQFLGPTRDGVSRETGLLEKWPDGGPKEVWRAAGGVGMSGLAVAQGRLVTLVQRDGKQWLVAHDAKTGRSLWQTALAPEYANPMGNGPRGTPAIADGRVFAFTGEGILVAADLRDGKLLWSHQTLTELKGKEAEYGMASSPLVVGAQVLVTVGAPQATVVAFDVKTGKRLWTSGSDPAGYSSPTLLNVGGRAQIVAFTGASALGLAPESGETLWRYPFETNFQCNIASPLSIQGKLFLSSGENHGSVLLNLTARGKAYELDEVWSSLGPKSVLRSEWQTAVLVGGQLYGMDNVGGAGPITHLTCIDAASGERRWQVPRFGKGNLIAADGKLLMSTMMGELVVARASPEKYQELGRVTVLESTRQAPSLAGGLIYLRDDRDIVCLDLRAAGER